MTVDDRTRLNLHRKLEAVLGNDEADTLMAHLPPVTWNEVATKDDVRASNVALRSDIDALGTQLRTEIESLGTQLRTEIESLGTQLRTEIDSLGTQLRTEIDTVGYQMRAEMQVLDSNLRAAFTEGHNRQIKWLVTFAAGWSSLLFSVFALIR